MTKENDKKKWTARSILFLILTWGVCLLLVEAGVRLLQPQAGRPVYAGYPADLVIDDDQLGHAYRPGFSGFFPAPQYKNIPIEINSWGFRDANWAKQPDPERPRIMVLGDSITFGSPIAREQRFTEQAALVLAERNLPVETCNLGVNGYGIQQYERLLKLKGPKLSPRIVLIGLCLNDAEPMSPSDARRIAIGDGLAAGNSSAKLRQAAARYRLDPDQSYAFNLARRTIKSRLWGSDFGAKMIERYNKQTIDALVELYRYGSGIDRLGEHLASMQNYTRRSLSAELAVLVFVYHHQIQNRDPALIVMVRELLEDLEIPHADLYRTFLDQAQTEGLYAAGDDCHPGPPGHRLAGEVTADLLGGLLGED